MTTARHRLIGLTTYVEDVTWGVREATVAPTPADYCKLVAAAVFGEHPQVQCSHHQSIDQLGTGLVATAASDEEPGDASLIEALIAAC